MADAPRETAVLPTISRPGKPPSIRLATIARALIVLTTLAVVAACYVGRDILAPILFALLLSLLFSPLVALIGRLHVPRMLASGLTVLLVIGIAVGAIAALAQPARDWVGKAPSVLQSLEQKIRELKKPVQQAEKATEKLQNLTETNPPATPPQQVVVKDQN